MDYYGFYTGKEFSAYEYLGAHRLENGTVFRTFAPNAVRISVIGEFNDWGETPMDKVYDGNFWECTVPGAKAGMMYRNTGSTDVTALLSTTAIPMAFSWNCARTQPQSSASLSGYEFRDSKWQKKHRAGLDKPLNIYEIHAGSWRRKERVDGVEKNAEKHSKKYFEKIFGKRRGKWCGKGAGKWLVFLY